MKTIKIFLSLTISLTLFTTFAQEGKISIGLQGGYNGGLGFQPQFTIYNLTKDVTMHLRFAVGYTFMNAGDALEARRIFINNNTNGTPEKSATNLDFRMDFLLPVTLLNNSYINFGPRYSSYKADYKFIGGNEFFDVTSHQWGLGAGLGNFFKINDSLLLEISAGADYYLPSTLTGHDTSYSPDNENINPRNDNQNNNEPFTYEDADSAINQPSIMPRLMLGVVYRM
jgi:hypothetical protein